MKNPDLCERPYCREKATRSIVGQSGKRRFWTLNVCDYHAKAYEERGPDALGHVVSERIRASEEAGRAEDNPPRKDARDV